MANLLNLTSSNPLPITLGGTGNTVGSATLVSTTSTSSNATFYPLFVSSSSNSNQICNLGTGLNFNPSTNVLSTTGLNLSGLTASQAIVTDSSKNLVSLGYSSSNTVNNLVQRDSSGNFSATTITANLNGNSTTSTTSTNANNVATTSVTTNSSFYPLFVSSSTNSNQACDLSIGLTFNPSNNVLSATGLNLSSLTVLQAVVTDSSKNLISLGYSSTNTASNLVQRDGSGNFSAGTITATLNGNASTATTATNATNVSTTSVSTNATFYPLFVSSSTNSNQASDLSTGLTFNPNSNVITTTGLNLSGLTASQTVVTDSSKNLVSLGYSSANTASNIVQRDGSGNFSAGTITASLSGNATTATTATNTTNVATTSVSTNATFYPLFVASSSNSNQACDLGTSLTFNPSTNILTTTEYDCNKMVLGATASAISGVTSVISMSSNYSDGNFIKFETIGAMGVTQVGRHFISHNLDYSGSGGYRYMNTAAGSTIELSNAFVQISLAPSGNSGTTATPVTTFFVNSTETDVHNKLVIINGTSVSLQNDNGSNFQAKNSSGVYETWIYPRHTNDVLYLQYGSGGFALINNSSSIGLFVDNSLAFTFGGVVNLGTANSPILTGALNIHSPTAGVAGCQYFYNNNVDQYPLLQILPYSHDNVSINFDAYFSNITGWTSSAATGNFQLIKNNSNLSMSWANVAAGGAIGWNIGITLNSGGNVGFFGTPSAGGGTSVIYIGNAFVVPTTNPAGGGILYVQSGALKYRGSSGTVTTIANA